MLVTREPGHHGSQSLFSTLILIHLSGAEVLARGLIGTCTQMEPITEMSQLLPLPTSDDLITTTSPPGADPLVGSSAIGSDD